MGRFGKKGIRTKRVSIGGDLDVAISNREHLHFFITAEGANPIFDLTCEHRTLWDQDQFEEHPKMDYERIWPLDDDENDSADDIYSVFPSHSFVRLAIP